MKHPPQVIGVTKSNRTDSRIVELEGSTKDSGLEEPHGQTGEEVFCAHRWVFGLRE